MNILHIAEHMGDGAGKAIGGLARLGSTSGDTYRILLLDKAKKRNHIDRCIQAGVEVIEYAVSNSANDAAQSGFEDDPVICDAIAQADIVILNWWGSRITDTFISRFPKVPCRLLLWTHKNGYYDPPLPDGLVDMCDGLLAATPWTLENPKWKEKGTLVWGSGDFDPGRMKHKTDYAIGDSFTIGYIGYTGYKRFPADAVDYYLEAVRQVPGCRFVLAGETDDKFINDIDRAGLKDKAAFLGWRADAGELLAGFDVFGYLTKPDIFAATENSITEAMASGLPVAMSRRPLGRFFVEDEGVAGFLFDNPKQYGEIIKRLYDDEKLRRTAGQNAREYMSATRSPGDNMERFNKACGNAMKSEKRCREYGNN